MPEVMGPVLAAVPLPCARATDEFACTLKPEETLCWAREPDDDVFAAGDSLSSRESSEEVLRVVEVADSAVLAPSPCKMNDPSPAFSSEAEEDELVKLVTRA